MVRWLRAERDSLALILHLTDLHLDARAGRGVISDEKVSVIEEASLQKRLSSLAASLSTLRRALESEGRELDSVVLTGDITHEGRSEGFALLTGLLEHLGDKLPSKDRILIVPGNHDVVQGTPASERERYERFLKLRDEGYLTAWLEGVDLDAEGKVLPDAANPPLLVGKDDSYVLVGVNSSNHSGSTRNDEPDLAKHLPKLRRSTNEGVKELLAAWEKRGEDDIARVDRAQRTALAALLASTPIPAKAVRIGAFHHHLYPVGDVEEIKAFETMLNLGEFQDWLASNKVSLALHGHKHVPRVGSVRYTPNGSTTEHHMLVVCGPSLEEHESNKQPIGRLIEIDADYPRVRPVTLTEVPSTSEGVELAWRDLVSEQRDLEDVGRTGHIVGETLAEVHHQLLAVADRYDQLPTPLVCRVNDGESCKDVPADFEGYTGDEPIDSWFQEIVQWWQRKQPGAAASFNHGERLYSFGFEQFDQIAHMVKELNRAKESSRALATLTYPERDSQKDDFPSFTLVHLLVRGGRLDVIAYFRKQEMPHWWPVNVAELAQIQAVVLSKLKDKAIVSGSITTVTAKPAGGKSLPRVAVPWIDRQADSGGIPSLLIPLFAADADKTDVLRLWTRVFSDWVPSQDAPAADGDPWPKVGLKELVDELRRMKALFPAAPEVRELDKTLRAVADANRNYSEDDEEKWAAWAASVREYSAEVLEIVQRMVDGRAA